MDKARSDQIIEELRRKGADQPCPRCGFDQFEAVAESYLPIAGTGYFFGDDTTPVVLIACQRCGFYSTHGVGRLFQDKPPAAGDNQVEVVAGEARE